MGNLRNTMIEQLRSPDSSQVIMPKSSVVSVLEELQALRELRLLNIGGMVRELRGEVLNEHELGREREPGSVSVHLQTFVKI